MKPWIDIEHVDKSSPTAIERYAKQAVGMTFRQILELDICPEGITREYGITRYKGGMGALIEERLFNYKANSNPEPDFEDAGVELKTTCFDLKKDGSFTAGERLVLSMIPYNEPIEEDFYKTHLWRKLQDILLIYYCRDKSLSPYDQYIGYVGRFTPSEEDLEIIRQDYDTITGYLKAGRAEDLSESLTTYLAANTKGRNAKDKSPQFYPPHTPAMRRSFSLKRSYMDAVLRGFIDNAEQGQAVSRQDSIVKSAIELRTKTFDDIVLTLINPHVGKTDRELCAELGINYTGNKAQWYTITYKLLGVRGERAEEFERANISVRTMKATKAGTIKESISLDTFEFDALLKERWEGVEEAGIPCAPLHAYFEETRFLFVVYQATNDGYTLRGARFWSMPESDIEGPLRKCWLDTRETVRNGVQLTPTVTRTGKTHVKNNLPKEAETGTIAHVRPHTRKAAYLLEDGTEIGNIKRHAFKLPDGRWMTKQSFWLNRSYIQKIGEPLLEK